MQNVAIDSVLAIPPVARFLDSPGDVTDDEMREAMADMTIAVSQLGEAVDRRGQAIDRLEVAVGRLVASWGAP
ncbi:MAG: hypothetical protein ABTD50_22910 [Polyangiaceae bacterium]|jgi:hypothetical protein